jgi:DNA-binding transcriptional LysR family regulator
LDDLVSMAMFARVVEAKSFTAAAESLGVSKSVVSKRVTALEERFRVRLLQRTTRRLALTAEGARLHERCLEMIRVADELPGLVENGDEPRGVLRVTCPVTFADAFFGAVVTTFTGRYRGVQVELSVSNALIDLISERVDVAIRMAYSLASSSLVARRLATMPRVLCASPAYLDERGRPRAPDELRSHECLQFSQLRSNEWRFREGRSFVIVPTSGPLAADNIEALRHAAVAGAGLVILPLSSALDDLGAGRLERVLDDHPLEPLGVFAVFAKGKVVPAKVRKFVDHLAAALRSPPWS